jgi:uncharacterized protein YjbI with pentapeptide repeats
LSGARLTGANFRNVRLGPAGIWQTGRSVSGIAEGALARRVDFTGPDLSQCDMSEADLERAIFTDAKADAVILNDALLEGAHGLRLFAD